MEAESPTPEPIAPDTVPTGSEPIAETDASAPGDLAQFVSFTVADGEYAVDIMQVREIKGWTDVTQLPNQPDYMRGVLNLRGAIVPIFDLRRRFGLGLTEATPIHVVVIVQLDDRVVGILVDTVSDILSVNADEIRPVPDVDGRKDQEFLLGLATVGERMVALLGIEKLVKASDLPDQAPGVLAA